MIQRGRSIVREGSLLHFCFFLKVFLCECPDLSVAFLVFLLFFFYYCILPAGISRLCFPPSLIPCPQIRWSFISRAALHYSCRIRSLFLFYFLFLCSSHSSEYNFSSFLTFSMSDYLNTKNEGN